MIEQVNKLPHFVSINSVQIRVRTLLYKPLNPLA